MEEKLINLFEETLGLDPKSTKIATMENTESWDSFSHITLMLGLEELVGVDGISPDNIIKLTSYKSCLEFAMLHSNA